MSKKTIRPQESEVAKAHEGWTHSEEGEFFQRGGFYAGYYAGWDASPSEPTLLECHDRALGLRKRITLSYFGDSEFPEVHTLDYSEGDKGK
jgi:hypothetical protein